MIYDFFISHASEDKEGFVSELANNLRDEGLNVWYDEFSLNIGDSLRRSIEKGIQSSKAGLIVLSHAFFNKEWPQRELDALFSRELSGKTNVYPIWYDIERNEIEEYAPLLADKVAIKSSEGMDKVIQKITSIFSDKLFLTDDEIERLIDLFFYEEPYHTDFLQSRCKHELLRLVAYSGEYYKEIEKRANQYTQEEDDENCDFLDKEIQNKNKLFILNYSIPRGAWLDSIDMTNTDIGLIESIIDLWVEGYLGQEKSYELFWMLDEDIDTDYLLVLFGIPNDKVTENQRIKLIEAIVRIGSRNCEEEELSIEVLHNIVLKKYYG